MLSNLYLPEKASQARDQIQEEVDNRIYRRGSCTGLCPLNKKVFFYLLGKQVSELVLNLFHSLNGYNVLGASTLTIYTIEERSGDYFPLFLFIFIGC